MSPSPETIKEVYVKKYREGYQLPDDRKDIMLLNAFNCFVWEDPGFVGRTLEKMFGSVTGKSADELYHEYMQLMVDCWDSTQRFGPERNNMGYHIKEAINGFREKLQPST